MKKKYLLIVILSIILLSIFTFYDLEISQKVANKDSVFGCAFQVLGQIPPLLGVALFGANIYPLCNNDKQKILSIVITLLGYLFMIAMIINNLLPYKWFYIVAGVLIIILLTYLSIYLFNKIDKEILKKLFVISTIFFLSSTITPLVTFFIKSIWGRVRFFDLENNYTRWYVIRGYTKNDSFPSGHTSGCTSLLSLLTIPLIFNITKKNKYILYSSVYSFIFLTALSRLIYGKHYCSDILVGFLLGYTINRIITHYILKKKITIEI